MLAASFRDPLIVTDKLRSTDRLVGRFDCFLSSVEPVVEPPNRHVLKPRLCLPSTPVRVGSRLLADNPLAGEIRVDRIARSDRRLSGFTERQVEHGWG